MTEEFAAFALQAFGHYFRSRKYLAEGIGR
jgi:hypothetical protein